VRTLDREKVKPFLIVAIGVVSFMVLPYLIPKFQLRIITEIIIFSLFATTWKMLFNDAGLFSFGHAVYFGVGAYASALCWLHIEGLSFLNGILIGGISGGVLGIILGSFLVRMSGTYFALLTLAFNQLLWAIVWKWREVTGGDDGLGNYPKPSMWGISMSDPINFYYISLVIVGASLLFCWHFMKTPLGGVIISIKSNEERVKFIGFSANLSKLFFICVMGFFAGISGALYAQLQEFIAAGVIDNGMSTNVLFMAFIGGIGFFWGPIAGSAIFVYLSEYLSSFTSRWEFIFGLFFVFIVLFTPEGVLGILKRKRR
jgi:branched-chain amino acid transport system permease protein